jgi:hypothetical protein
MLLLEGLDFFEVFFMRHVVRLCPDRVAFFVSASP